MISPEPIIEQTVVEKVIEPAAPVASEPDPVPNKATEDEPKKAPANWQAFISRNKATESDRPTPVLPPNNFPGGWKLKDRPKK